MEFILFMSKTITKIVVQKKRKDRVSIFLNDEFAFGLHQDIVFQFALKKGDQLSENQIEEMLVSEEKKKAKERGLNFLSYRDRSEKEMRTKLKDVGFDESIIDWLIEDLKRLDLINDRKFALNFASSKLTIKPMGEFLLKRELFQKGIHPALIDETIEKVYSELSQQELACQLADKRKRMLNNIDEQKAKKRVSDFLLRRGFNWDIVSQVIEQWGDIGVEGSND